MKSCLQCGTQTRDDALACANCCRTFAVTSSSTADAETPYAVKQLRPDGSGVQITGIILGILGALGFVISFAMNSENSISGDIDPALIATKAALSLAGGALLQVGLIVWLAGYIVRAISFIPGRTD